MKFLILKVRPILLGQLNHKINVFFLTSVWQYY